ncbi:MAG: hypothetical protein V7780_13540 [Colwellia sp.]
MNKIQLACIGGLSITLLACGGSGSDPVVGGSVESGSGGSGGSVGSGSVVNGSKEEFIKKISETSWLRECFPAYIHGLTDSNWSYFNIRISINSSLESITTAIPFSEQDCNHHSRGPTISFTTQLEVTDKIISEEGIEVYGLNSYLIESPYFTELPPSYSLIYLDSEKLYYGIASGANSGMSKETRHSSISLDDYFWQGLY